MCRESPRFLQRERERERESFQKRGTADFVFAQWTAITAAAMAAWETTSIQSRNAFETPPD